MELPLNRLLITGPPGQGKTTLLRRIVRRFRMGGTCLDPMREIKAPVRWETFEHSRFDVDSEEMDEVMESVDELERGTATVIDEAHRFLPSWAGVSENPLLSFLDTARNDGVSFALATKRPSLLPTLITDLADVLLWRPWRSAAARRWLADAGLPPDLKPPPIFHFYAARVGADPIFMLHLDDIARAFGKSLHATPINVD